MLTFRRRSLAGSARPVAAVVLLADLFVVALAAISLQASYQQYLERAAVTSRNTNRLVAQTVASEIDRIDLGLRAIRDEHVRLVASGEDRRSMTAFLRRQQERLPMTDSLRVADAQGKLIYGSDAQLPAGVSIADRDYFVALRTDASRGLVISRPVLGRISHKWVLIFARALSRSDGSFDGVVSATVTIDWFNDKFAKLEVGPQGAVVLRGDATRDFDLLARFPQAGFVGQTKVSPQFTAMITAKPEGGTYEARAGADNIQRTFSYQRVGGYPLITLVGLGTEDTLAGWWRELLKMTTLAVLFILMSALGGWTVQRAWNARTRAYRQVQALNEELSRDNAARRTAEAEISRLNAELEQRVQARTAELEAANRELESFSYSVSHDLRAPLRAIDGFSQMLSEDYRDTLDADGRHFLEVIRTNATRMGQLIDDILDFSRMGRQEIGTQTIDMGKLAREVFEDLREATPGRRIDLALADPPPGRGDPTMIRQVLVNLLANAIKFTARREEAVIEFGGQAGTGWNRYYVKDNGVGFDPQYADRLFGVFQRLHPASEYEGTGIGLAIVKRIVERHGGQVRVDGSPDAGATFHFTLPCG